MCGVTQSSKQHTNTQNQLHPKSWTLYPLVSQGYRRRSFSVSCRHGEAVFIWGNVSFIRLPLRVNNPAAVWPLGHHPTGKRQHNVFQASGVLYSSGLINKHKPSTNSNVITGRAPTAGFTLPLSPARAAAWGAANFHGTCRIIHPEMCIPPSDWNEAGSEGFGENGQVAAIDSQMGSLISLNSLANQAKNNNSKRQIFEKLGIRLKCQWCMWITWPKRMPGLSQATALCYFFLTPSSRMVCSFTPPSQWKAWVALYSSGHWTHPPNFQLNFSYFLE